MWPSALLLRNECISWPPISDVKKDIASFWYAVAFQGIFAAAVFSLVRVLVSHRVSVWVVPLLRRFRVFLVNPSKCLNKKCIAHHVSSSVSISMISRCISDETAISYRGAPHYRGATRSAQFSGNSYNSCYMVG